MHGGCKARKNIQKLKKISLFLLSQFNKLGTDRKFSNCYDSLKETLQKPKIKFNRPTFEIILVTIPKILEQTIKNMKAKSLIYIPNKQVIIGGPTRLCLYLLIKISCRGLIKIKDPAAEKFWRNLYLLIFGFIKCFINFL